PEAQQNLGKVAQALVDRPALKLTVTGTANLEAEREGLQRERLALLEGFDDKRSGLAGVWLAYNAVIKVTADGNGAVTAKGW
ncbi:hypothetical protein ABTO37_19775, partial [Acinetobacter baumannii]